LAAFAQGEFAGQFAGDSLQVTLSPQADTYSGEIVKAGRHFPLKAHEAGIAPGWKTNSQSLMTGVLIKGPADQEVNLAIGWSIITRESPLYRMHEQIAANARLLHQPPPPPIQALIAPYSDPETALRDLFPQVSQISQAGGGPALDLEKILSVKKIDPMLPGGQAALITYDFTKTLNGAPKHYRSAIRLEMTPIAVSGWMFYGTQVVAPVETYDQDLPTMIAMAASLKENAPVIVEKTRENIEAANARFAAQQKANRELQAAFDSQRRHWEHNQLIQDRSFADFDEVIVGYRTVEDTTTGARHSVNLGNAHDIVERLNEYDPGRYKEVPLKDEMYPLDGR
jgi:hypothetical protein